MSGPQCCENPPTLDPNSGTGHVEKLAGLDTYVVGSPASNRAILLISDIFGALLPFTIVLETCLEFFEHHLSELCIFPVLMEFSDRLFFE